MTVTRSIQQHDKPSPFDNHLGTRQIIHERKNDARIEILIDRLIVSTDAGCSKT
jgi:hypothetical protein